MRMFDAALDDYFASLKDSPHALTAFLEDMPKGGELHMHFFGSGYAEPAIAYARHPELCIEHDDYSILYRLRLPYRLTADVCRQ